MVPQVELFSFIFLGELKTPKRHFEINWPLESRDACILTKILIKFPYVNMIMHGSQETLVDDFLAKGQLISKYILVSSISSKKHTKTRRIIVKTKLFVRFLEEITAWQFAFEITWPLALRQHQTDAR